jgi:hypothetical protein
MGRTEIELQTGESFTGIEGLWLVILLNLLQDLLDPGSPDHLEAKRIIDRGEYPLSMIAAVLETDPEDLQRRIVRALRRA